MVHTCTKSVISIFHKNVFQNLGIEMSDLMMEIHIFLGLVQQKMKYQDMLKYDESADAARNGDKLPDFGFGIEIVGYIK